MGIKFSCPQCQGRLNVKAFLGGKRGVCPKCGASIDIPAASEIPDAEQTDAAPQSQLLGSSHADAARHQPRTAAAPLQRRAAAGEKDQQGPSQPAVKAQTAAPAVRPNGVGRTSGKSQPAPARPAETRAPATRAAATQPATSATSATANSPPARSLAATSPATNTPAATSQAAASPALASQDAVAHTSEKRTPASKPNGRQADATPAAPPPPAAVDSDILGDANAIWYVLLPDGGQYGPADGRVLQQWIDEGRVAPETYVWRAGWEQWKLASEILPSIGGGTPAAPVVAAKSAVAPSQSVQLSESSTVEPMRASAAAPAAQRYLRRKRDRRGVWITAVVLLGLAALALLITLIVVINRGGN